MTNKNHKSPDDFFLRRKSRISTKSNKGGEITTHELSTFGTIAVMCPNCYHNTKHYVTTKANSLVHSDTVHVSTIVDIRYTISKCPICAKERIDGIEIDPNIADAISILNQKGYYTKACCDGHSKKDEPYIYFKDKDIFDALNTLPLSWYVDYKSLMHHDALVIRADGYNKENALIEILIWAMELEPIILTYVGE